MTKLSYMVLNEEYTSYSKAVARSQELGVQMVRRYTPIEERTVTTPEERAKRMAAIREKAAAKK